MELLSFSVSGTPLLLSASDTGLFLHSMQSGQFGRPVLLCSNYKNGLSGCEYNQSLYYTYINRENALLLRRLGESAPLLRSEQKDTVTYHNPQLIVFNNTLFLFYMEETQGSYRLRLQLPFSPIEPELPDLSQTACSPSPLFTLHTTGPYLYLFLTTETTTVSYRYTRETGFETLSSEEALLSKLRTPWDAEKKQLEQSLIQAIHLSEQQQNLLTEKEQKLLNIEAKLSALTSEAEQKNTLLAETTSALQAANDQLTECKQDKQRTAQKLEQTSLLLERAKTQYSELMQVAEQYRQEALKWYGKFTDRH